MKESYLPLHHSTGIAASHKNFDIDVRARSEGEDIEDPWQRLTPGRSSLELPFGVPALAPLYLAYLKREPFRHPSTHVATRQTP